jgi:uncharacterized membrane protein (UPF0136 family)
LPYTTSNHYNQTPTHAYTFNQTPSTRQFHNHGPPSLLPPPPPLKANPIPSQSLSQVGYILATLTAGGGTIGYLRTGSIPSVAAGCTVGALYALGAYRISQKQPYGVELALLASVVLAGSSIPRAIKSQKSLPIGLSLLASFGMWTYASAMARGYNKYNKTV